VKPLAEMEGESLTWTQLRAGHYSLRGGEDVFAQFRYQTASGSLATGEASQARWTFKRIGLQRPRITARRAGQEKDVAVLKHSGRGEALLELADGRQFRWKATRARRREKGFYDPTGELILRFYPQPVPGKVQARVELGQGWTGMVELPLLVLIGWYRWLIEVNELMAMTASATAGRTIPSRKGAKRLPPIR
jgi:hypothetical protein